jgi:hypothetical protein
MAVQFRQHLALHLQLHLRILLEDLRIALPEQLCYLFVGHAAGAEPGGVCRSEIVDTKVSNTCPAKSGMPDGLEGFLVAVGIIFAREKK